MWLYMLHFEAKLKHAGHYTGATAELYTRLTAHANGHGARITEVLAELGMDWRLGMVAQITKPTPTELYRLERLLKDRKHGPKYCEICNPNRTYRIPGTTPIPIAIIHFPTNSTGLRRQAPEANGQHPKT